MRPWFVKMHRRIYRAALVVEHLPFIQKHAIELLSKPTITALVDCNVHSCTDVS